MPGAEREFESLDHSDPMVARILDAAEECICRYGIRRTSMGEVARVGKLSRGTIYRHFADKASLVEGVFRRLQENSLNRMEAALEKEATLVDKLTCSVIMGRKERREGIFASLAETEPETAAVMFMDHRFYRRSIEFWPPHIHQAQEAGEVAPTLGARVATDFIMRLAVSLVMFPDMGVELKSRRAVRGYLEQVLLRGLGQGSEAGPKGAEMRGPV